MLQVITPELNEAAVALLRQLLGWQERLRLADPINAKRKKRLVSGMREVSGLKLTFSSFLLYHAQRKKRLVSGMREASFCRSAPAAVLSRCIWLRRRVT